MFKKYIASIIFLIIGIAGTALLVYSNHLQNQHKDWIAWKATVTKIDVVQRSSSSTERTVYVSYTYESVEYKDVLLDGSSSDMVKGKEIDILLNPKNPNEITWASSDSLIFNFAAGFTVFGLSFAVLSAGYVTKQRL